jgi:hypothetical protein
MSMARRFLQVAAALLVMVGGHAVTAQPASAEGEFVACVDGGGAVSSYNDGGIWVHYCQGGTQDGLEWIT